MVKEPISRGPRAGFSIGCRTDGADAAELGPSFRRISSITFHYSRTGLSGKGPDPSRRARGDESAIPDPASLRARVEKNPGTLLAEADGATSGARRPRRSSRRAFRAASRSFSASRACTWHLPLRVADGPWPSRPTPSRSCPSGDLLAPRSTCFSWRPFTFDVGPGANPECRGARAGTRNTMTSPGFSWGSPVFLTAARATVPSRRV